VRRFGRSLTLPGPYRARPRGRPRSAGRKEIDADNEHEWGGGQKRIGVSA
jgi:hypothetical protein